MQWSFLNHYAKTHPMEVAEIIESKDLNEILEFIKMAPRQLMEAVTPYFSSRYFVKFIDAHKTDYILNEINSLPIEKIISILSLLNKDKHSKFISILDNKTKIQGLVQFGSSFVGSIVEPCTCVLYDNATIEGALERVEDLKESGDRIYILNKEHELIGFVDLFKLLKYREHERTPVNAIMKDIKYRISANTPIYSVYQHRAWREYASLPVINNRNHLIGMITHQKLKKIIYPKYKTPYKNDVADDYTSFSELIWQAVLDLVDTK